MITCKLQRKLLLTLICFLPSIAHAQSYPSASEITAVTNRIEPVLAEYLRVTGRVTFNDWQAPYNIIKGSDEILNTTRTDVVERMREQIRFVATNPTHASTELFRLYGFLESLADEADRLMSDIALYNPAAVAVANDLLKTEKALQAVQHDLFFLILRQLSAADAHR
jgi:hypothetical protein